MLKYLIVILDDTAKSFCYYNNKDNRSNIISLENLKQIALFALKNNLTVNFLYGKQSLPKKYFEVIKSVPHTQIIPIELEKEHQDGLVVVNYEDLQKIKSLHFSSKRNIIFRIPRENISELAEIIKNLQGQYERINVVPLGIESYMESDLEEYKKQLDQIKTHICIIYEQNLDTEINIVSDRIVLTEMHNCNAGIQHITLAPNGKFYLCPAFYEENENNNIGDLSNGIEIKNKHLLQIEYAPICRNCDAFQCKRCIYLNRLTTLELNVPSREQCILSHYERNTSMSILNFIKSNTNFLKSVKDIPEIEYLDPFEVISENPNKINEIIANNC